MPSPTELLSTWADELQLHIAVWHEVLQLGRDPIKMDMALAKMMKNFTWNLFGFDYNYTVVGNKIRTDLFSLGTCYSLQLQ